MSGRLGLNLRRGNLAEELGFLLLKGLAAVAEIPRTEDFGIDAVATLLRDDGKGLLYAEDSFYVQIKSSSVGDITYKNHQVDWLKSLKLPIFIASVDLNSTKIKLFTTNKLSIKYIERDYRTIKVILGNAETAHVEGADSIEVAIGTPLLEWGFEDFNSKETMSTFSGMIKNAIAVENKNIQLRHLGFAEEISWETNKRVAWRSTISHIEDRDVCKKIVLEAMRPLIHALSSAISSNPSEGDPELEDSKNLETLF